MVIERSIPWCNGNTRYVKLVINNYIPATKLLEMYLFNSVYLSERL